MQVHPNINAHIYAIQSEIRIYFMLNSQMNRFRSVHMASFQWYSASFRITIQWEVDLEFGSPGAQRL